GAVAIRVLARLVDVEFMMRVLDQRDGEAKRAEARDQLLDQRCLAAAGPAGESEHLHDVSQIPCSAVLYWSSLARARIIATGQPAARRRRQAPGEQSRRPRLAGRRAS